MIYSQRRCASFSSNDSKLLLFDKLFDNVGAVGMARRPGLEQAQVQAQAQDMVLNIKLMFEKITKMTSLRF